MPTTKALDALAELGSVEDHNFGVSVEALGESMQLLEDVVLAHDLMEELIGSSKGPFQENVVTTDVTFLLSVRYHLMLGVQAAFRGHRNNAYVHLRRGIEATAFAARVKQHPEFAMIWLRAHTSVETFDDYKKKFGTGKLFPASNALLAQLGETYELVATFSHPSLKALAGHAQVKLDDANNLEVRFDYLQLDEGENAADLGRTYLALIRSNIRMLRVFAEVFPEAARDAKGKWELRMNTLDASFTIHAERWRPVIQPEGVRPDADPTDVALRRLLGW